MKVIDQGNATTPKGYQAAGIHVGVKPGSTKKDLALVYSAQPASAAAVYTTNRVQAAPIQVDREHLQDGKARAVVLNSGNANACTGALGLENARRMCRQTAATLKLKTEEVLVCSTGVIGVQLPIETIEKGIPAAAAALAAQGGADAAQAIMTTDTVPKTYAVETASGLRVGGMAKGAGMIAPHMATMLAVVACDAAVAPGLLKEMLSQATRRSFNSVTVDGDMSTNDTLIALANGAAGAPLIDKAGPAADEFYAGLEEVCRQLARQIARDGEGATKLVAIRVANAQSEEEARKVGLAVANSSLVKTAIFGCDPNWGRILCAVGYSGAPIDPGKVQVSLCGTPIYAKGSGCDFDKEELIGAMREKDIPIHIDLQQGRAEAEIYTCDLSYEYVRVNAEYTT
ncbi:MAG: bifunctional glutamate N-acetyltransferase/amino-acid acetyltransferase ArgJ [Candidatus Handelsmanbacteria bacterium]|nr:bifunctional glutamate N-acetyltransferase/amino-acid acetyltransferase ArgJ [Candidatus Handelsmanbacteria bacterium]